METVDPPLSLTATRAVKGVRAMRSRLVVADLECFGSLPAVADWNPQRMTEVMSWTTVGVRDDQTVLAILAMDPRAYTSEQVVNPAFHEAWKGFDRFTALSGMRLCLDITIHHPPGQPGPGLNWQFGLSPEHDLRPSCHAIHLFAGDFVGDPYTGPSQQAAQRWCALQLLGLQADPPNPLVFSDTLPDLLGTGQVTTTPDGPDEVVILQPPHPLHATTALVASAYVLRR